MAVQTGTVGEARSSRRTGMARNRLAVVVGLVMALGVMGTALAEGGFVSNIVGGRVGFQSRRWTDRHLDAAATIVRFEGCRDASARNDPNDSAAVNLWRDVPFAPDPFYGQRAFGCWVAGQGNYGEPLQAGDYYFEIAGISNGAAAVIDVPVVRVSY